MENSIQGKTEIVVTRAEGTKCGRCWKYQLSTGKNVNYPSVCHECADTLIQLRFPPYRVLENGKLETIDADIVVPSWLQRALKLPATIPSDPKWFVENE